MYCVLIAFYNVVGGERCKFIVDPPTSDPGHPGHPPVFVISTREGDVGVGDPAASIPVLPASSPGARLCRTQAGPRTHQPRHGGGRGLGDAPDVCGGQVTEPGVVVRVVEDGPASGVLGCGGVGAAVLRPLVTPHPAQSSVTTTVREHSRYLGADGDRSLSDDQGRVFLSLVRPGVEPDLPALSWHGESSAGVVQSPS